MSKPGLPEFYWEGRSLTKRAFWLVLAKTLAFVFSFTVPLLLVRQLTLMEFGLYKQVFLIVNTAITVLPLGFVMSAFYFLPREPARKGQVVCNILLFYILIGLIAFFLLIFRPAMLGGIFNVPDLVEYAPLIGVVVLFWMVSSFFELVAVANEDTGLAVGFIVAANLTKALLLLAAALLFGSLRALIYAGLFQAILQTAVLLLYLGRRFRGYWRAFDWPLMRAQLAYALPLGFAAAILYLETDLHNYVVSNRFGAAAYAIYAIGCFQLPLLGILRESVGAVMIPRVNYLRSSNEIREIVILTARMMRKLAAVFFPTYLFLLVTGREFITVLFTAQYLESWPIFAIHLTMIPIGILGSACDPILRAWPEHRYFLLRTRLVLFVALAIGLWFGTEYFYLVGAISIVVGVNLIEHLIIALRVGRILRVSWDDLPLLRGVGKLAAAAALAAGTTVLARGFILGAEPWVVLVACAVLFGFVYLASVLFLGVLTSEERRVIRQQMVCVQRLRLWKKMTLHSGRIV